MARLKTPNPGPWLIQPGTLNAYLLALVFVAIATTLCVVLSAAAAGLLVMLLFLAVIASAMFGGVGPGVWRRARKRRAA